VKITTGHPAPSRLQATSAAQASRSVRQAGVVVRWGLQL